MYAIQKWVPCRPLGSGASAQVSLALELHHGLLFAVKSFPCCASGPAATAALNELHILKNLSSPFVIRYLGEDYTNNNGTPVSRNLFLEYMEGGSLAHLIQKSGGHLQERQVRFFTRAIVQGLSYLHHKGIVHCDIKGHNILFGSSGVKIADFGASKHAAATESGIKEVKGTPLWMAPEVVRGTEQGFPSDVWSLGCTVVEMIQGLPPWGHITEVAAALYRLGCSKEFPPLPESISEDARDFLLHCFQRDPKARWTAAQLLQHPFVSKIDIAEADEANYVQAYSPRSTLDFLHSDSDSDYEKESDFSSTMPMGYLAALMAAEQAVVSSAPSATASRKRHFTEAFNIPRKCD